MIVVTARTSQTDIDRLACACAYRELLTLSGIESEAVLLGPLNGSVPTRIRTWGGDYIITAPDTINENTEFVIVDDSEPDKLPNFVNTNKVIDVFDHHPGFEKFWADKIGGRSKIVKVGACATLIWEEFVSKGLENKISERNANLLYTAILSNTLYLRAHITTKRDIQALEELKLHGSLPIDWAHYYFEACEEEIIANLENSLKGDIKVYKSKKLGENIAIGQLELWDSGKVVKDNLKLIERVLDTAEGEQPGKWFLTAPSISESKNYIYTKDTELKQWLEAVVGVKFYDIESKNSSFTGTTGFIGYTNRIWMRKEIVALL